MGAGSPTSYAADLTEKGIRARGGCGDDGELRIQRIAVGLRYVDHGTSARFVRRASFKRVKVQVTRRCWWAASGPDLLVPGIDFRW